MRPGWRGSPLDDRGVLVGPYWKGFVMESSPPLDFRGAERGLGMASGPFSRESIRGDGAFSVQARPVQRVRRQAKAPPHEAPVPGWCGEHGAAGVKDEKPTLEQPVQVGPEQDPGPGVVFEAPVRDVRRVERRLDVATGERAAAPVGGEDRAPERRLVRPGVAPHLPRLADGGVDVVALRAKPARDLAGPPRTAVAVLGERGGDGRRIARGDGVANPSLTL